MTGENSNANSAAENTSQQQGQFAIQKVYTRDVSFETPNSPEIFREEWKPEVKMNLSNEAKPIGEDIYDVALRVTLTVTNGDKTAYLAEVDQAGIFNIAGMPDEKLKAVLGIYCPNILFPYIRSVISDLVTNGGFPQMLLSPVNFEMMYAQQMSQQAGGAASAH